MPYGLTNRTTPAGGMISPGAFDARNRIAQTMMNIGSPPPQVMGNQAPIGAERFLTGPLMGMDEQGVSGASGSMGGMLPASAFGGGGGMPPQQAPAAAPVAPTPPPPPPPPQQPVDPSTLFAKPPAVPGQPPPIFAKPPVY